MRAGGKITTIFALTGLLLTLPTRCLAERRHAEALRKREVLVLIVRGFEPGRGAYLDTSERHGNWEAVVEMFERMGFSAQVSRCSTGSSIADGAGIVEREIAGSRWPVLAVGHSLGGLKILEALRRSRAAANNTAGVLLVHCPNHGATACTLTRERLEPDRPLADLHDQSLEATREVQQAFLNFWDPYGLRRLNPFWSAAEDGWYVIGKASNQLYRRVREVQTEIWFEFLWGGDKRVLDELSPENRRRYMWRHGDEIRNLGDKFPIVSVIGYGGDPSRPLKRRLYEMGYRSDEVVETSSQELGVGATLWFDVSHMEMAAYPWANFDKWEQCVTTLVREN